MIWCWQRILHLASVLFCMTVHPVAGLAPWPTSPGQLPPTCRSSCPTASVPCNEASGPWLLGAFWQLVPASVDCAWNWNDALITPTLPPSSSSLPRRENFSEKLIALEEVNPCSLRLFIVGLHSFMFRSSLHVFLLSRPVTHSVF